MKLNLSNTVNNSERGRSQRSVVWLKHSQPCLHHLHVLSTTFSWRPLSSLSLWIILLPSDSRCFVGRSSRFSLRCLQLRLAFVQSLFPRHLGRQSWREVFCLGVSFAASWFESSTAAWRRYFRETERLWLCIHLLSGQAVHNRSGQAVHELTGSSGSRA